MPEGRRVSAVRLARVRAGLGVRALGDAVGLNRSSVYRIESGRAKPKLATRMKLAAALKTSERALFGKS